MGALAIFGLTLQGALDLECCARDLDVVELFSGVGEICKAAARAGFTAESFDLVRLPGVTNVPGPDLEDITTCGGFHKALQLVLRIRVGGLLTLAPDCRTFTFPNSVNHKRRIDFLQGDESYEPVFWGNTMAVAAAFLMQVAIVRQVHLCWENPPDSFMPKYLCTLFPPLQQLEPQTVHRCAYDKSQFPRLRKLYKFFATGTWIKRVNACCKCPGNLHQHLGHKDHIGKWTGDKDALKASAAYPCKLGEALISAWLTADPLSQALQETMLKGKWCQIWSQGVGVSKASVQKCSKQCRGDAHTKAGPWDEAEGGMAAVVEMSQAGDMACYSPCWADTCDVDGPWMGSGIEDGTWMESGSDDGPWGGSSSQVVNKRKVVTKKGCKRKRSQRRSSGGPWAMEESGDESTDAEADVGQVGSPLHQQHF